MTAPRPGGSAGRSRPRPARWSNLATPARSRGHCRPGRLVDARASYGVGLETFALGFPVHFDWSWRTLLNKDWEDALFTADGGSEVFRKPKFAVWIGYDF